MIKRMAIVPVIIPLLLCGCSHKTEVRDKGFIRAIGCDSGKTENIAVRLYGEEDAIDGSGSTIFSAIDNAETTQSKTLFTGHLELLVLNPNGVKDTLSVMIKNNRISPSCSIIIAPEKASDLVRNTEESELSDILKSSSRKGKIVCTNISTVLNDLLEEDSMAAVPIVKDGKLRMGIIDGNNIIGILSEEESEGYCWLNNDLYDIYMPIQVNGREVNFQIRNSTTKLTAEKDGDNIKITTEIKVNGNCIEDGISESDASKAAAERISGICSKTISKTVTGMNADVLGIKKCIDSNNIIKNSTWDEIIPKLKFYYSIKIAK